MPDILRCFHCNHCVCGDIKLTGRDLPKRLDQTGVQKMVGEGRGEGREGKEISSLMVGCEKKMGVPW